MRRLIPFLSTAAMVVGLASCCERDDATIGVAGQEIISDAVHSGGHAGVYLLPPLVPRAEPEGAFDGTLNPVVQIHALDRFGNPSGSPIATFATTGGPSRAHHCNEDRDDDPDDPFDCLERSHIEVRRHQYRLAWHTDRYRLDPAVYYRVSIRVGSKVVSFFDVDVVANQRQARNVDNSQYVALVKGRTLSMRWFMNRCAPVDCAGGASCDPRTGACSGGGGGGGGSGNLVESPGFEVDTSGFAAQYSPPDSVIRSTSAPLDGTASLQLSITVWGNSVWWWRDVSEALYARSRSFTVAGTLRGDVVSSDTQLLMCAAVYYLDDPATLVESCSVASDVAGQVVPMQATLQLDASRTVKYAAIHLTTAGAAPVTYTLDDVSAVLSGLP